MQIQHALAAAQADAANLLRYIERRERFLDALDRTMLTEDHARQSAMLDELLEGDLADSAVYIDWLVGRLADESVNVPGVLRFTPRPRRWHAEWITLAALSNGGSYDEPSYLCRARRSFADQLDLSIENLVQAVISRAQPARSPA